MFRVHRPFRNRNGLHATWMPEAETCLDLLPEKRENLLRMGFGDGFMGPRSRKFFGGGVTSLPTAAGFHYK